MKRSISFSIITSFLSLITLGALFLMLPVSTHSGSMPVADAFFTSFSAVTVTGLIVVNTGEYFTLFGQTVILFLIQLGGLGFMSFSTLTILMLGKKVSISNKLVLENDFSQGTFKNIKELILKIIVFTFGLEIAGAILLYFHFGNIQGPRRIFVSIFHSVSAFCNAGFSVFENGFIPYLSNVGINSIMSFLIITGGLGFLVLNELSYLVRRKKSFSKFSIHSKLVLIISFILIMAGAIIMFIQEILNKGSDLSPGEKLISSFFQSVSARTAGFNTVDLGIFASSSIFILLLLMFIGASPGSTGGGIKTTSLGLVLAYFRSRIQGKEKVHMFYRNISQANHERAFLVVFLSLILISFSLILVLTFDNTLDFRNVLFEVVSAFGTVGLSLGITPELSLGSKIVIMITMLIGRIGPLTLLIAISKIESRAVYDYPEEKIMIG